MNEVLRIVSDNLQPSNTHSADDLINNLEDHVDATLQLGGSVAKQTHGGSDYDVDIFIKYPMRRRGDKLSDDLEAALRQAGIDAERVQASRDYFIHHGDHDYELVPVLNIEDPDQAETVIDVSPLHVKYFNDRAGTDEKQSVRLLKQFLKANHIYGAESHINGFSGHVVDLLILAYGSFQDVLQAVTDWQPKTIIDLEEHHTTPMLTLNESKTHGPLIVVDPIQPARNAAAAVNQASYDTFKTAANEFLASPEKQVFHEPSLDERYQVANNEHHIATQLNVSFNNDRHDVTGSRLQKIKEHLVRRLQDVNFHIDNAFIHHEEESAIILTTPSKPKADHLVVQGPPVDQDNHVERFKQAHSDVEEEHGRLIAHEPNPYQTVHEALNDIISDNYVQKRCQDIKLVRTTAKPSN